MIKNTKIHTHFGFIDVAKGLGIILVVCSHVYHQLMDWALPFFIPLFFIISGYCTTRKVSISGKFKKLILPYILFTILLMIVYLDFKPINFIGFVYSRWCLFPLGTESNILFFRIGNGPLWFLTSMFVAFILFKPLQSNKMPWLIVACYLVVTYALSFLPILLPWSLDTAFLMAVFIFVGSFFREKMLMEQISLPIFIGLTIIYSMLTIYCGKINLSVRLYGTSLLFLLPAAVIGSSLLMKLSVIIDGTQIGHILQRVGIHSLPIFCIQMPFIQLFRSFFSVLNIGIHPAIIGVFVVFLVLFATYPIAIVLNIMLDFMKKHLSIRQTSEIR